MLKIKKIIVSALILALALSIFCPVSHTKAEDTSEDITDIKILYTIEGTTKEYEPLAVDGQEIRLFKETTISGAEAIALFANAYSLISKQAVMDGVNPDIDDADFQEYAMAYYGFYFDEDEALENEVHEFVRFLDIYENKEKNEQILKAIALHTSTLQSSNSNNSWIDELEQPIPQSATSTLPSNSTSTNFTLGAASNSSSYDADAAVSYAKTWWNKTNNTKYPYYARYNGFDTSTNDYNSLDSGRTGQSNPKRSWQDCTNFVSQCIAAGGAEQVKNGLIPYRNSGSWFYNDSKPSHTWGGAQNFYNHWKNRIGVESDSGTLDIGDPVSIDFTGDGDIDHTVLIVASGSSNSKKLLSAHTIDRFKTAYKNGTYTNWSLQTLYDADYTLYGYDMDKAF